MDRGVGVAAPLHRRLVAADYGGVSFRWKDYRVEGPDRWKTMTLTISAIQGSEENGPDRPSSRQARRRAR
jgi:hypothetical protein